MDSSLLIKESLEYLDNLSKFNEELNKKLNKKKIDNSIKNELLNKMKDNLKVLEDLKNKMELQGFDTPYIGVGKLKGGGDESDIYEIKSYTSYLRRMVSEKKNVLERVKYSIISHKIGISHLDEKYGNYKLVKNLLYSGNYGEELTNIPSIYSKAYKKLMNIFNKEGKPIVKSTTLDIRYKDKNNRIRFKRIKVEGEDYDEYVREKYGDAQIINLKKNFGKNKLLNDSYVKKTLSLSYLKSCIDEIDKKVEEELKNKLSKEEMDLLNNYKKIISNYEKEDVNDGIMDIRLIDEIKYKKLELIKKLESLNYYKDGKPTEQLKKVLDTEKEILEQIPYEVAVKYLSQDMFNFYIHHSYDERSRLNTFPSILLNPTKTYFNWMKIDGINPSEVLDLKFLLEDILPKYNLSVKNSGGVSLYLLYDWDIVKRFGFNKKDVEELLKKMSQSESLKETLKEKGIDIKKLEKYNTIKKEKTKKLLKALEGL